MKRSLSSLGVITILVLSLLMQGPRPAQAKEWTEGRVAGAMLTWGLGSVALATLAYVAWVNRPGNPNPPDWSVRGPGGFFVGGFMGAAFAPSYAWSYKPESPLMPPDVTQSPMRLQPGVVGGLKAGYFFHKFPYFGLEGEFNITRNDIKRQGVTLNKPLFGSTTAIVQSQNILVMTLGLHFLGRYGFLKDEQVPFGRLQPYVGIGPGFVVVYGEEDSAKNFSLEVLAGVRYMLLKNLSTFVEYKFSQQWAVELEHQKLWQLGGAGVAPGRGSFDFTSHKVVVGFCYHFR